MLTKTRTAYTAEGSNFRRFSLRLRRGIMIFLAITAAMNKWTQRQWLRQQRPWDLELLSGPPNRDLHCEINRGPSGSRYPQRDQSRPLRISISPTKFVMTSSRSWSPLRDPSQHRFWRSRFRRDLGSCHHPISGTVTIDVMIFSRRGEKHWRIEWRERRKGRGEIY